MNETQGKNFFSGFHALQNCSTFFVFYGSKLGMKAMSKIFFFFLLVFFSRLPVAQAVPLHLPVISIPGIQNCGTILSVWHADDRTSPITTITGQHLRPLTAQMRDARNPVIPVVHGLNFLRDLEDPIFGSLQQPLSTNYFCYARGNPTRYTDPDGRASVLDGTMAAFAQTQGNELLQCEQDGPSSPACANAKNAAQVRSNGLKATAAVGAIAVAGPTLAIMGAIGGAGAGAITSKYITGDVSTQAVVNGAIGGVLGMGVLSPLAALSASATGAGLVIGGGGIAGLGLAKKYIAEQDGAAEGSELQREANVDIFYGLLTALGGELMMSSRFAMSNALANEAAIGPTIEAEQRLAAGAEINEALDGNSDIVPKGGGDFVSLYRSVGDAELKVIQSTGRVPKSLNGLEVKYFSATPEGAASYARQAVRGFGDAPYTLVETRIARSSLPTNVLHQVDRNVPAVVLPNTHLPMLGPANVWPYIPLP